VVARMSRRWGVVRGAFSATGTEMGIGSIVRRCKLYVVSAVEE
jgi:hypothetical protein